MSGYKWVCVGLSWTKYLKSHKADFRIVAAPLELKKKNKLKNTGQHQCVKFISRW